MPTEWLLVSSSDLPISATGFILPTWALTETLNIRELPCTHEKSSRNSRWRKRHRSLSDCQRKRNSLLRKTWKEKTKNGEVSSCDLHFSADLNSFNQEYLKYTSEVSKTCIDRDLSEENMVIGTSAIIDTEIDGAVGMNSGIFNNPFMIWGRYRKQFFRYFLPISFQFHHTQMDGAHAGKFLCRLQNEIESLKWLWNIFNQVKLAEW